jgi:hypothetical protein
MPTPRSAEASGSISAPSASDSVAGRRTESRSSARVYSPNPPIIGR